MKKLLFTLLLAAAALPSWAEDLYLVGNAVSVDWNINNALRATKMTETSPSVFEWTGYFKESGQFKILTNKDSWDYGYNATSSIVTLSDQNSDIQDRSGGDNQWKVASDGVYKITVNTSDKTIKAESATMTIPALTDGYYQIGTADDLVNFADAINKGAIAPSVKAKLTSDIDMSGRTDFTPISCANAIKFTGEFDGQGHAITNLVVDYGTSFGYTGLFCYATDGAVIKNLIVGTGCSFKGTAKIGGIIGSAEGGGTVTLTNVINMANVTSTGNSSANAAGLVGCGQGGTIIEATNCANTGKIQGQDGQCAAFAGWTQSGTTFTNCWNSGEINNIESQAQLYRNSGQTTATNCYDLTNVGNQGTKLDALTLGSGELCYILNGNVSAGTNWYQNLESNVDSTPVPFSTHSLVYANGNLNCDGTPKGEVTYSNTEGENRDDHNYVDGFCSYCHTIDVAYLTPVDGFYELNNMKHLHWFSQYVIAGNPSVNAKLTADITMESANQYGYTPIGSSTYPYTGHFDGQGHSVTLNIDNPGYSYQGLFGIITDGVSIEKVIVKGTVIGNDYVGGIAGGTNGGSSNAKKTNIWNCGNEATITANGANGAGIIGVNKDGSASVILLNCYNTGNITSNREGGAMSGWLGGGWSNVRNCYNSGTIKNNGATSKAFGRNNGCYFTNCYYTASSGTDNSTENHDNGSITMVEDAALTSGELCWNLGTDFTQDLSDANHPTFGSKVVHAGKWFNNDDWDVFYNEEGSSRTSYVLNLDETKTIFNLDPNFTLTAKNVSVARNIPAGQWIGLCLPFDYDIPDGWDVRKLDHVNGSGESASMVFASASSIEAGKPYIVKPTEAVTNITATNKAIATESTNVSFGGVTMVGNLCQTSIPQGSFYINTSSQLKKLTAVSATLKGFRAYFTVDNIEVKALDFIFDDDATGIEGVQEVQEAQGAIYNLAGQRINKMQKGINIINGKKILK